MSVLVLDGIGASPYAIRGATQTLEPIDAAAQMRRTVNGALINIASTAMRKYRSTIRSNDQRPPAFDGIWPGMSVVVDCIAELSYPSGSGSSGTPQRTVVSGSSYEEQDYTFYRPQLTMRVVSFTEDQDEYGAQVGWTLELEEI